MTLSPFVIPSGSVTTMSYVTVSPMTTLGRATPDWLPLMRCLSTVGAGMANVTLVAPL